MMKKKLKIFFQILLIIIFIFYSKQISAQINIIQPTSFFSYFEPGNFCINLSLGYLRGFCCNFSFELVIFENFIGNGPIDFSIELRALYREVIPLFSPEDLYHDIAFSPILKVHFGYINNIDQYIGFGYGLLLINIKNLNNITSENIMHGVSFIYGTIFFYNKNIGILAEISIISWAITIGVGISFIIC